MYALNKIICDERLARHCVMRCDRSMDVSVSRTLKHVSIVANILMHAAYLYTIRMKYGIQKLLMEVMSTTSQYVIMVLCSCTRSSS